MHQHEVNITCFFLASFASLQERGRSRELLLLHNFFITFQKTSVQRCFPRLVLCHVGDTKLEINIKKMVRTGHGRTRKVRGRGWLRGRVAEGACEKQIRLNP